MTDFKTQFMQAYATFSLENLDQIMALYQEQVVFEDPFRRIEGKAALETYCRELCQGLCSCRFEFETYGETADGAFFTWKMHFAHKSLKGGHPLTVPGSTLIRCEQKVSFHRDYYDAGAMLYENIPLLGGLVRMVKRRL